MSDRMEEENEETKLPEFTIKISHKAKLRELLKNLCSIEAKLSADASKEFIRILKSDLGPEFTRTYVQTSSKLVEISQAWEIRKGKSGFLDILKLITAILRHWNDSSGDDGANIGRALDKFARVIVEEKMGDLYKELNSKEAKRQNAVLLLLASIVRRSSQLAWEMAKVFDFKLRVFPKLAEVRLRAKKITEDRRKSYSTRKAFVAFAMAFLEVGHPRLLRGVLQQKEMYSGVLRGLGNDDEETVVYVLSVLRNRVLVPESLVPTGLRSVLFGSVTLEQLVSISGRDGFGDAADLAHKLLVMVCTDPMNGLMPDLERQPSPLRGNPKRLSDVMKKLKAIEVENHRDLLLTIVKGRPSFGSTYLDEFPYNLEDPASTNWFSAVSLAADVVSSVNDCISFGFGNEPPAFDSTCVQNILKCIGPRPLSRLVINKGLLHSDSLAKHGTLKFVMEALKLLDSLVHSIDSSYSNYPTIHSWASMKADIQNEVRMLLPDPQVLFSLLSPLTSHLKSLESTTKRKSEAELCITASKKLKRAAADDKSMDILVGGVMSFSDDGEVASCSGEQQSENAVDIMKYIGELWGLHQCSMMHMDQRDSGDTFFYTKLLDALTIYYRTMPMALEGLFDLFKFLPNNPLSLPSTLLESLLQLLNEYVGLYMKDVNPIRSQPQMYKHLHPFVILLMYSPVKVIKERAYHLARAAMLSTGAFDHSPRETFAWLFFIPGYCGNHIYVNDFEVEIFQELSSTVVSFLCDAVSTTGNSLYKYIEFLRNYFYDSAGGKDLSPEVSPFIICVVEKCVRLLSSESGSFSIPQKSLISLYVCDTIKYLLDTQVDTGALSFLVDCVLSDKLESIGSRLDVLEPVDCPCEWRPLKDLLHFVRNMVHQQFYSISSNVDEVRQHTNSFADSLIGIQEVIRSEYDIGIIGVAVGFSVSLLCAKRTEILQNFPSILTISINLFEVPFSVLASLFFNKLSFLADISKLWPEMFFAGLEIVIQSKEEKDDVFVGVDLDSFEAASGAFASYLRKTPFHVLFSSIVQSSSLSFCENSVLRKLLLDKLAEMPSDHLISSLCNILFWIHQAHLSYKHRSADEPEMLSEMCSMLAEHVVKLLLVDTVSETHVRAPQPLCFAAEVAEIIFKHPAVTAMLSLPMSGIEEFPGLVFGETLEILLESAKQRVHRMDHHVLNLLKIVCDHLCSELFIDVNKQISEAFTELVKKLFLAFKNNYDECIRSMDFRPLVPTFYALHSLRCYISPFRLLELVNWLFDRIDLNGTTSHQSSKENAIFVCLHLAGCSFDCLLGYRGLANSELYTSLDRIGDTHLDVLVFEKILFVVFDIADRFNLDIAYICLLKAARVIKMNRVIQHQHHPCIMILSRVIASIPIKIISHCMQKLNRTRAQLLCLIVELSPLHLSVFGDMFFERFNKLLVPKTEQTEDSQSICFSDDELLILLPAVLSYSNSAISKFGEQHCKPFHYLILAYWRLLFDGFSNWKFFVRGNIFEMGLVESLPASTEEFLDLFSRSLLGMAILMMQDHLALREDLMVLERRLSLFNAVCPYASTHDNVLDSDENISLESVNRIVAKVNLSRILLFPYCNRYLPLLGDGDKTILPPEVNSDMEKARIWFIRMLITSWVFIVKKFPDNIDYSANVDDQNLALFRFLELFMMNNILDLTAEMHDSLIKLDSLPFIDQLVKSFLLYRFGDPVTLKILRTALMYISQGKFSCASVIQLLLAHSQFANSFQQVRKTAVSTQFGLVFTPLPSFLRSYVVPHATLSYPYLDIDRLQPKQNLNLLELIKFVRVLFHISVQQRAVDCGENIGINSRELIYLLLSFYGATCNEVDLEMYNLILEIESTDNSSAGTVAQMNYLWGVASLKMREYCGKANDVHSLDPKNMEFIEETRKIQFRENLPVDPKLCARTVLYFPYHRVDGETFSKVQRDNPIVVHEASYNTADKQHVYDPVYILRFSINCLSLRYIEPVEFTSLGLLGIAFVSISSPDDNMRKLGYEALTKFKNALEKCQKKKEVRRLCLLLSYLQNGIEEPWQRIPSVIAVFAAEASLVLLDPSHDNYSSITKHLLSSPCVNMKAIPLFQNFFWSSSTSFRADRLWMLRLLCVGLNTEDDAQTYIRNSVCETMMSFYSSPFSDNESKGLILQVVKKAVQLPRTTWFLVERCGLILWLSSIVSSLFGSEHEDKKFMLTQLLAILEVINDITLVRSIVEWLQNHALEQLSEFSSHLFKLLVGAVETITEHSTVCCSILQIITLVLKMSQKRKIYQPHFTLSEEGLFQLHEAVKLCSITRSDRSMLLGLEAVLMSTPPCTIIGMDQEKLSQFLEWAVTTTFQDKSAKVLQPEYSADHFAVASDKRAPEESLVSKLLRWLTASVILGNISSKPSKVKYDSSVDRPNLYTLMSSLGCWDREVGKNVGHCCEDILAASIFYLLQQLGFYNKLLPSVVSALCLLQLSGSSEFLIGLNVPLQELASKIHYPAEANPSWRWSFYQPWRDLNVELSDLEKLEEIHACERLLVIVSNVLVRKFRGSHFLSLEDVDKLRVHERERSLISSG